MTCTKNEHAKDNEHTQKNTHKPENNQKWLMIKKGLQCAIYNVFIMPSADSIKT